MVLRRGLGEGHSGREPDLRRARIRILSIEENVRRGLQTFSSGDLEASLATMDSEIQWYITFRLPDLPPDMTVVRGHDQVRELWNAFRSVWEQVTVEVVEVLEQSDDVLVCKVRFRGQGSASGVEVDRILYYVFEMSAEEMLKRIQPFDDPDEALRAAGMGRKDH